LPEPCPDKYDNDEYNIYVDTENIVVQGELFENKNNRPVSWSFLTALPVI
jgi:hypothetical protein